jgi:microcin C transport system substrate-binding protein
VQLKVEFLSAQPDSERLILPYIAALQRLGIKANLRIVDSTQYVDRVVRKYDFDITTLTLRMPESPGNEQRYYWGSDAADKAGSGNFMGVKNPAIDKLIDKIILAKSRPELVAATRALDRVLLWNHYMVPQGDTPYERVAVWSGLARPAKMPRRQLALYRVWWWDAAKAKPSPGGTPGSRLQ